MVYLQHHPHSTLQIKPLLDLPVGSDDAEVEQSGSTDHGQNGEE
jgi:hypothetical protein